MYLYIAFLKRYSYPTPDHVRDVSNCLLNDRLYDSIYTSRSWRDILLGCSLVVASCLKWRDNLDNQNSTADTKWDQHDNANWNTVKNNNSYESTCIFQFLLQSHFFFICFICSMTPLLLNCFHEGFHTIRITEKESALLYILLSWLQVYDGKDDCLHVSYTRWCDCLRVIFHTGQL